MSTPLTDSINALTTYANEVTGVSDATLSDAVHTLAQGYGQGGVNYFAYVRSMYEMFAQKNLPETVDIDFEGNPLTSLYRAFDNTTGVQTITLRNIASSVSRPANYFARSTSAKTVNFIGDALKINHMDNFILTSNVETINGKLDLSQLTRVVYASAFSTVLKDISFVSSTISVDISFAISPALTDASLISIANGLNASATGKTLTLHTTSKARCSTLMGNNVDGLFVADVSRTMSLADFITTVKGWTLA